MANTLHIPESTPRPMVRWRRYCVRGLVVALFTLHASGASAEARKKASPPRVTSAIAKTKAVASRPAGAPGKAKPKEAQLRAAGGEHPGVDADVAVVKTEGAEQEGVKTYTFGAQEVEGRLRSPQILYFLRRVRAEFDPRPLGHRSFMLELSDSRRHSALR